jgi:hypothetical protein
MVGILSVVSSNSFEPVLRSEHPIFVAERSGVEFTLHTDSMHHGTSWILCELLCMSTTSCQSHSSYLMETLLDWVSMQDLDDVIEEEGLLCVMFLGFCFPHFSVNCCHSCPLGFDKCINLCDNSTSLEKDLVVLTAAYSFLKRTRD